VAEAVYVLCALTSAACCAALLRGYRRSGQRLLLWSGLCFAFLALNNALLFVDLVIYPERALYAAGLPLATWRAVVALAGLALLLCGLIWDSGQRGAARR